MPSVLTYFGMFIVCVCMHVYIPGKYWFWKMLTIDYAIMSNLFWYLFKLLLNDWRFRYAARNKFSSKFTTICNAVWPSIYIHYIYNIYLCYDPKWCHICMRFLLYFVFAFGVVIHADDNIIKMLCKTKNVEYSIINIVRTVHS